MAKEAAKAYTKQAHKLKHHETPIFCSSKLNQLCKGMGAQIRIVIMGQAVRIILPIAGGLHQLIV